ncbi:MAG: hypothetical protein QW103_01045 [Candidatus Pacearchaeota archaeon]
MRQKLEQVLYEVPRVQERERVYRVVDLDYLSASVLYTGPIRIYDFRDSGFQFHVHGSSDGNSIYEGTLKRYGSDEVIRRFNGYETSIFELYAQNLGIKRLDKGKDY